MSFSAVMGQDQVKEKLVSVISGDPTGTYLFYGPSNVGKRTMAFEMAKSILCEKRSGEDCLCRSCKKFNQDHPDFLCIGWHEKIKVVDIDSLLEFSYLLPLLSRNKVIVIDNAENITWEAANRLLKVLEEPPAGFVFILVSANPEMLLPTILSRCIKYEFKPLSKGNFISIFQHKLGFEAEKALILGALASESSMDIFSKAGQYLKYRDLALTFVSEAKKKDVLTALDMVDKVDKQDVHIFSDMLLLMFTDILLIQNGITTITNADKFKDIEKISETIAEKPLYAVVTILSQVKREMHLNVNMPLVLKNAVIKTISLISSETSK
jgi:DNA polymerase III subunit delta'